MISIISYKVPIMVKSTKEEWKQIPKYPDYWVSSLGRTKSYRGDPRGHLVMGAYDKDGYRRILMYSAPGVRKMFAVHRLVAQAFVPNPHPEKWNIINHKDENTTNNQADNLEWCDIKYNDNYGNHNKRVKDTRIRNGYIKPIVAYDGSKYIYFTSIAMCADYLGVSVGDVSILCNYQDNNYKNLKSVRGYQVVYAGEEDKFDYSYKPKTYRRDSFVAYKDNKKYIFNNKSEASRELNIDGSYITKCLRLGKKAKGWALYYI